MLTDSRDSTGGWSDSISRSATRAFRSTQKIAYPAPLLHGNKECVCSLQPKMLVFDENRVPPRRR